MCRGLGWEMDGGGGGYVDREEDVEVVVGG